MLTGDIDVLFVDEFEPVRRDLLVIGRRGSVEDVQEMPDDPRLEGVLRIDGDVVGHLTLDRGADAAARLCVLADFAQDLVLEKIRDGGGSVVWPGCVTAGHGHPMRAATADGRAVWTCPADPSVSVPIGALRGDG